jgi:hypothetical protein
MGHHAAQEERPAGQLGAGSEELRLRLDLDRWPSVSTSTGPGFQILLAGSRRVSGPSPVVRDHLEVDASPPQRGDVRELVRRNPDGIEKVREAAGREAVGLAQGGNGEGRSVLAGQPGVEAREVERLVGLGVVPQADAEGGGFVEHPPEVPFQSLHLDDCCGSLQLAQVGRGAWSRRVVHGTAPARTGASAVSGSRRAAWNRSK